jgi:chorismate mutase
MGSAPKHGFLNGNLSARKKLLIAGPCSVESEEQMLRTAMQLSAYEVTLIRGGVWKPRTRPGSFEGVGGKGLVWLKQAGNAVGLPVATEAANPAHVGACLKAGVDVLWIGARTTTSPFAVQEIADALRGVDIPVMIKNPMNPDIELWIGAIERINKAGITKIIAVHRGFSTYGKTLYRNQPIWRIPIELRRRLPHLPLICDPSHICGKQRCVMAMAQQAIDLLFDGLMIEVHCAPRSALSDPEQQMTPAQYGRLISQLHYVSSSGPTCLPEAIRFLRNEIDEIDNNVIALLAKRMECVKRIGIWKRNHNISLFQPERWEQILQDRIQSSMKRHLSGNFVRNLFEQIHEEALNIQGRVRAGRSSSRRHRGEGAFTAEHFESASPASGEFDVAELICADKSGIVPRFDGRDSAPHVADSGPN